MTIGAMGPTGDAISSLNPLYVWTLQDGSPLIWLLQTLVSSYIFQELDWLSQRW